MIVLTRHGNKNIQGCTENIRGFSPLSPPLAPPLLLPICQKAGDPLTDRAKDRELGEFGLEECWNDGVEG